MKVGIEDVVEAVKERLYERARSPFVSAFIIAWTAINFRAIYAFIMSESYSEAFQIVDVKIWSSPIITIWLVLISPILSVFLYLYLVPIFEREAVKLWANGKLKVRDARIKIEESASLDIKSIDQYTAHISDLNTQFSSQLATLKSEHSETLSSLKRELDSMRNRYCDSIIPEEDIKSSLSNMTETDRDILFVANRLQPAHNNIVNPKDLLSAIKSIRTDITEREVSQSVFTFSMYGLIKQDLKGPSLDTAISLSTRGKNLALRVEAAGLSPKPSDINSLPPVVSVSA